MTILQAIKDRVKMNGVKKKKPAHHHKKPAKKKPAKKKRAKRRKSKDIGEHGQPEDLE